MLRLNHSEGGTHSPRHLQERLQNDTSADSSILQTVGYYGSLLTAGNVLHQCRPSGVITVFITDAMVGQPQVVNDFISILLSSNEPPAVPPPPHTSCTLRAHSPAHQPARLLACLPLCLFVRLSACTSVHSFVRPSNRQFVCPSVYLFVCLTVCMTVRLSVRCMSVFVSLPVYRMFICLSIYMYILYAGSRIFFLLTS